MSITDHNAVHHDFRWLEPYIVHIIDHHAIIKALPSTLIFQDIRVIASASTIIAELILNYMKTYGKDIILLDKHLFMLLISAILVDNNVSVTTEKDTEIIEVMVEYAVENLGIDLRDSEERTKLRKDLLYKRNDISDFNTPQMIRKDYKEWFVETKNAYKYGISTIPITMKDWKKKEENMLQSVIEFMAKAKLQLYIANLAAEKRKLLMFCEDVQILKRITDGVSEYLGNKNVLVDVVKGYAVISVKVKKRLSRKVLQPSVHKTIEEYILEKASM